MRSTNLKEQGMGEHNFGDYIVFVDESGDQSLKSVNANYPCIRIIILHLRENALLHACSTGDSTFQVRFLWLRHSHPPRTRDSQA